VIILLHPRTTKPKNRRFPLSVLSLAAVLEGKEDYIIIDGNVDPDPQQALDRVMRETPAELLAVSVMPGPQMVAALPLCREFRKKHPSVPIAWGGYFPSLYTDAVLNSDYVDYAVRGPGQDTFLELIATLRKQDSPNQTDRAAIAGLSYTGQNGKQQHNPERPFRSPNDYPWLPYHQIDAAKYIQPTFLGQRTAVHEASVGCPYQCNFCGVITAYGSREKMEDPTRTEAVLRYLKDNYAIDAVQFYDNNFFLSEDHAREQADRFESLNLRWWCEARIDIVLGYSDATLRALKRAGATMIFFGAESGSDWVLKEMNKQLKAEQTLDLARRLKDFDIVPEFSFVVGNPRDPQRDINENIAFVRKIKTLNPASEIILQHYIPTPQRKAMYGGVDDQLAFPDTLEEWATSRWYNFTIRTEPNLPWLPAPLKHRVDDFELVVSSRWPTIQDFRMPAWGRALLQSLSSWRYATGIYANPHELQWAQRFVQLRKPKVESL